MLLQFTKGINKASILGCTRPDGTHTWTKIQPAIEFHDLAHYAVESVLGFDQAFYGLVSTGFSIEDFELPREQRPQALIPENLPHQALQTEHIVNLLQVNQSGQLSDREFLSTLENILEEHHIPFPEAMNEAKLIQIRTQLDRLLQQWEELKEGEILELEFSI